MDHLTLIADVTTDHSKPEQQESVVHVSLGDLAVDLVVDVLPGCGGRVWPAGQVHVFQNGNDRDSFDSITITDSI
jgi:hypothetical protein